MTTDLECQEFQKRGERKRERERERERKKERDILQMCMHLYLYFFTVTRSSLLALSSHVDLSLSLSLSLFVCVYECGRVLVCCPLLIPSSSLSQSLSQTYTHSGTEQNYRCQATIRLWPEKMLKKSLMETRACACELTRTNPRAQKGI